MRDARMVGRWCPRRLLHAGRQPYLFWAWGLIGLAQGEQSSRLGLEGLGQGPTPWRLVDGSRRYATVNIFEIVF